MKRNSSFSTRQRRLVTAIKLVFLVLVAFTMLFPFYWVTISSFKSNNDIFGNPLGLPTSLSLDAVATAWNNARMGFSMLNSLFYCSASIVLIMLLSAMVSFVLAQVRPNKALYAYFSFGLLIPIHAMIIPLNVILNQLHLGHTRWGLIIAYVVLQLSLSVFLLTATMRSIPREMTDASIIDGCSGGQVFWRIILPLSRAGLATVGTLAFINSWNDLLLGMIIAPTRALQTINVAVSNLRVSFSDNYNVLAAGITCMFIPSVIIYSLFQKQIIKGLVSGAVKG
jgi:raffinose/stachyose/melibiose transport system permease protein